MKNEYEIRGEHTVIFSTNRKQRREILIDTKDLELVKSVATGWHVHTGKYGYVHVRTQKTEQGKKKSTFLNKLIMNPESGMVVDHINHDTLDNRRINLRVVTPGQNGQNRNGPPSNNSSGYRGVYREGTRWRAQYRHLGIDHYLGTFSTKEEAHEIVREARMRHMPFSGEY